MTLGNLMSLEPGGPQVYFIIRSCFSKVCRTYPVMMKILLCLWVRDFGSDGGSQKTNPWITTGYTSVYIHKSKRKRARFSWFVHVCPMFFYIKKDKRGRGSERFSFCSYFCSTPITPIIRTHSSSALVRLVSAFFPPISYTPLILIQVTVTGSRFYLYRRHVTDRGVKHLHSDDKQGRQGKRGNKSRQPSVRRNTVLISRDVNSQVSRSMMLA